MTVTLKLTSDQEHRLREGAARRDGRTVREIVLQAVDPTVERLLRTPKRGPATHRLATLLDEIAAELHDAPALPDAAVSRAGIYAGHS